MHGLSLKNQYWLNRGLWNYMLVWTVNNVMGIEPRTSELFRGDTSATSVCSTNWQSLQFLSFHCNRTARHNITLKLLSILLRYECTSTFFSEDCFVSCFQCWRRLLTPSITRRKDVSPPRWWAPFWRCLGTVWTTTCWLRLLPRSTLTVRISPRHWWALLLLQMQQLQCQH